MTSTEEDFVKQAALCGQNLPRLAALRAGLRSRMLRPSKIILIIFSTLLSGCTAGRCCAMEPDTWRAWSACMPGPCLCTRVL